MVSIIHRFLASQSLFVLHGLEFLIACAAAIYYIYIYYSTTSLYYIHHIHIHHARLKLPRY